MLTVLVKVLASLGRNWRIPKTPYVCQNIWPNICSIRLVAHVRLGLGSRSLRSGLFARLYFNGRLVLSTRLYCPSPRPTFTTVLHASRGGAHVLPTPWAGKRAWFPPLLVAGGRTGYRLGDRGLYIGFLTSNICGYVTWIPLAEYANRGQHDDYPLRALWMSAAAQGCFLSKEGRKLSNKACRLSTSRHICSCTRVGLSSQSFAPGSLYCVRRHMTSPIGTTNE